MSPGNFRRTSNKHFRRKTAPQIVFLNQNCFPNGFKEKKFWEQFWEQFRSFSEKTAPQTASHTAHMCAAPASRAPSNMMRVMTIIVRRRSDQKSEHCDAC